MKKTIAFHSNQLGARGTEVALFDYAKYNETILGNRSLILYDKNAPANDQEIINKFSEHFSLLPYQHFGQVDDIISTQRVDILYVIKSGNIDSVISRIVPTMVHAVFGNSLLHVHGAAYAYVSEWLSKKYSFGLIPAVPHIVQSPTQCSRMNLREELSIPANALVLGGYGGKHSFDIDFVKYDVIPRVLSVRSDIFFLFMNFIPFIAHPRVLFLQQQVDSCFKEKFVSTCDAMLHSRHIGETFGLSCAEFSSQYKPIFSFRNSPDRCHHMLLKDSVHLYSNADELTHKLLAFSKPQCADSLADSGYLKYTPSFVMSKFDKHLIDPAIKLLGKKGSYVSFSFTARRRILDKYRTSITYMRRLLTRHLLNLKGL